MHFDALGLPLHYEALGVSEGASPTEIRAAWRRIAAACHPDAAGSDPQAAQRFSAASLAWSVLRDSESRRGYDEDLRASRLPACARCRGPLSGASGSPLCVVCLVAARAPAHSPGVPPPVRGAPPAKPRRPRAPPPPPAPPPKRPATPVDPSAMPPIPEEPPASRARREAGERAATDRTRVYDDINEVHAPSGDSLLEALLADAAIQSARLGPTRRRRKKESVLEVKVAPGFTVSLKGETAETLRGVNRNLKIANRILSGISKFFSD